MNNDHKKNKNSKNNNNNNSNNNEKNDNKILIDYFNSMYIDCINFSKNIVNRKDDNQCDFIKEKINNLNQTKNPDNSRLRHHIIYAVAK
jgi:Tfp pilus tip-associated adhesin PilY1